MPTYEYACSNCQNQWEEVQKISEPALDVCPKCTQHTARRQISGGRFILKGGGWYADLYSSTKPGKGGDSGGAKSEAKAETKSETATSTSTESSGGGSSTSTPASTPPAAPKT